MRARLWIHPLHIAACMRRARRRRWSDQSGPAVGCVRLVHGYSAAGWPAENNSSCPSMLMRAGAHEGQRTEPSKEGIVYITVISHTRTTTDCVVVDEKPNSSQGSGHSCNMAMWIVFACDTSGARAVMTDLTHTHRLARAHDGWALWHPAASWGLPEWPTLQHRSCTAVPRRCVTGAAPTQRCATPLPRASSSEPQPVDAGDRCCLPAMRDCHA